MSVRVSGKHMDVGESFRQKIEDNISLAVTKYFDGGYSGQVTVTKSSQRYASDCKIHLDTGIVLHAAGEANDPQASFDAAAERIEKRLRRYKRKLKDHHNGASANGINEEFPYAVVGAVPDEEDEVPEDFAPTIVAETSKQVRTMTVASAVMALDMTDEPVLVFRSPSKELNIVYRRNDGNIGWIDAATIKN
ncbi:ribosome-associated translation inhibitor RaiA [Agrobacterium larrymoorei]|uniref:ribosome hibernation-promoting factor, HPF/YfiA family n=1 Tax=Agrobacterium larrymoorei TaxID=160699 RepID=UPI001571F030|nr:ribosome-associated translation inhibitor RaiA [Agrobacterium larrymoorei]NTJ41182.1 ribosome-associated translation inhibitor RaiA [Agrobacterium larrymoorei]